MNDEFKFGKEVFEVKRTYQPKKRQRKKRAWFQKAYENCIWQKHF